MLIAVRCLMVLLAVLLPGLVMAQTKDTRATFEPREDCIVLVPGCDSPNEIEWQARYYRSHSRPVLGPEQRLENGVTWRLHTEKPPGLAVPRIVRMDDPVAVARANRLFDAMHGGLLLAYAQRALQVRGDVTARAQEPSLSPLLGTEEFIVQEGEGLTAITYASSRLVSYVEHSIVPAFGGSSFNDPLMGVIFDLDRQRVFGREQCDPDAAGEQRRFFRLGALLEVCDAATFATFAALFDKHLLASTKTTAFAGDERADYCREAMLPLAENNVTLYLTPSGLAVQPMSFFPNSAKPWCLLRKTAIFPVIIPYREMAGLMKHGLWREELLK